MADLNEMLSDTVPFVKPTQIAIADDDVAFANYLKAFLDSRGYQARIFSHGEALLAAATENGGEPGWWPAKIGILVYRHTAMLNLATGNFPAAACVS